MFCVVRYIYCSLAVLFLSLDMYCQDYRPVNDENDSKLDYYELICGKCLSMKEVVLSGGIVSRQEASGLIDEFLSLNREIKSGMESLSESQKIRFERISLWFASGKRPAALDDSLGLEKISGYDISAYAEVLHSGCDSLYCNPADRGSCRDGMVNHIPDIRASRRNQPPRFNNLKLLLSATCSVPLTYGLRIGLMKGRFGGYVSGKSDFRSVDSQYNCTKDGLLDNGMPFWSSGTSRKAGMSVSAGLLFKAVKWIDIYAGAGYGYKKEFWQDIDGNWASVTDLTYKGPVVEAGVVASWRRLSVSIGVSSVSFRTASLDIGLGVYIL